MLASNLLIRAVSILCFSMDTSPDETTADAGSRALCTVCMDHADCQDPAVYSDLGERICDQQKMRLELSSEALAHSRSDMR